MNARLVLFHLLRKAEKLDSDAQDYWIRLELLAENGYKARLYRVSSLVNHSSPGGKAGPEFSMYRRLYGSIKMMP
jgi:hypothetical protein